MSHLHSSSLWESKAESVFGCTELVAIIFEAYLESQSPGDWQIDAQKRSTLKVVCKFWRAVLESTPDLWSNIVLIPEMPPSYMDQFFRFSKAVSKRLEIRLYVSGPGIVNFSSHVGPLLVSAAETITHLSMRYSSLADWNVFASQLSILNVQSTFSSLRQLHATVTSLHNSGNSIDIPHPFPGLATEIQYLHLEGLPLTPSIAGSNLISLTLLNLDLVHSNAASSRTLVVNLLDCLRSTPKLNTLMIGELNECCVHESVQVVVLPNLHRLTYLCKQPLPHCGFLISLITVPQLETLSVRLPNIHGTRSFISGNQSKISIVTELNLLGDVNNYVEFSSGQARLLLLMTPNKLERLYILDTVARFHINIERRAFYQPFIVEILVHALTLPTIQLLVIPTSFFPPHPVSRMSSLVSVFGQVLMRARTKRIYEEHALCNPSDVEEDHLICTRLWFWEDRLRYRDTPSHPTTPFYSRFLRWTIPHNVEMS
ncbi:hypothetical protein MIND_01125000 [Mycena indigotica]|uniref:F-box domain-containing protein n=1 Tax=Mycena indigotica TaxID=2126181 RepID=A0A8H6S644_9AGAR|nr:uncharacterized protein MIND_01125000 [Mycena indigotica]KAF7293473.1 hypothetical protein MIND_01125000 [Mycena indigotica]